ncbi:unnamed protein product [Sphagnum compactum]
MKLVLDMTEYSVHGAREALNVSLAQYEPLMLVVAATATCFLLSIATSAVNSAVLVLSGDVKPKVLEGRDNFNESTSCENPLSVASPLMTELQGLFEQLIIPETPHSAYDKAAQYFQIKLRDVLL